MKLTSKMQSPEKIHSFKAEFSCEGPNNRLYNFEGTLKTEEESVPMGPNQVLLRVGEPFHYLHRYLFSPVFFFFLIFFDDQGSRLKNTPWIYGLVIYTGHDSKLLMNSRYFSVHAPLDLSFLVV